MLTKLLNKKGLLMSNTNSIWLTTKDNPFDFYEQFEDWYHFDESKGYCTCGLIARFVEDSEDLTRGEMNDLVRIAIDEILAIDSLKIYKIISENDKKS